MPLPLSLDLHFRVATNVDIRSWSFGALTSVRAANADRTQNRKGSLHDQRIFGPVRDFHCACGKYEGPQFENMVCDMCGVKIASKNLRDQRFGHIDFTEPIVHPFDPSCRLTCFPVLPANYYESPAGTALQELYDRLIMSIQSGNPMQSEEAVCSIVNVLTPIAQMAYNWSLPSVSTLARGLALETK